MEGMGVSPPPFILEKTMISNNEQKLYGTANIETVSALPTTPEAYYGANTNDVAGNSWVGGEMVLHTGDNRVYFQTATSGRTATWKRLLDQVATTTTTSSTTSTTTSSSSTTSSSTSSSSTTTGA